MQKTPLSQMIREELIRASILAIGFGVMVGAGTVSVAYAANSGGEFGRILNLILLKSWDDPTNDGTVRNSDRLGGQPASAYTRATAGFSCTSATQCIYGLQADGTPMCR